MYNSLPCCVGLRACSIRPSQRFTVSSAWALQHQLSWGNPGGEIWVSSLLLKLFPLIIMMEPQVNEEHSRPFTSVLLSLLLPLTASSPCFLSNLHPRTHTATHKCTHINIKPVAHTKQVFILSDVTLLSMFLHLCVCICVCRCMCMCVCTLVFPLLSGLPTTNIPPSLFPSFSLPLSLYFFFLLPAVDHEIQAQPFLQIPALTPQKIWHPHM